MIEVHPQQITPAMRAFFRIETMPGRLRFAALLAGDIAGRLWVDNAELPRWGILQESVALAHRLGYGPMKQYRLLGWY